MPLAPSSLLHSHPDNLPDPATSLLLATQCLNPYHSLWEIPLRTILDGAFSRALDESVRGQKSKNQKPEARRAAIKTLSGPDQHPPDTCDESMPNATDPNGAECSRNKHIASTDSQDTNDSDSMAPSRILENALRRLTQDNEDLKGRIEDYHKLVGTLLNKEKKSEAAKKLTTWPKSPLLKAPRLVQALGNIRFSKRHSIKSPIESLCHECRLTVRMYEPRIASLRPSSAYGVQRSLIWETDKSLEETAHQECALCLMFFGMLSESQIVSMRNHKLATLEQHPAYPPFLTQYWCTIPSKHSKSPDWPEMHLTHQLPTDLDINLKVKIAEVSGAYECYCS